MPEQDADHPRHLADAEPHPADGVLPADDPADDPVDDPVDDGQSSFLDDVQPRGGSRRARPRRFRGAGCLPVLLVLALLGAGGYVGVTRGIDWVQDQFSEPADFPGPGQGAVTIEVPDGAALGTVAASLEESGVVASTEAFVSAAEAVDLNVQPGFYRMREEMAADGAVQLLASGDTRGASFTILPGKTVEELVTLLVEEAGIPRRDFEAALDEPRSLDLPAAAGGDAEGYLFPGRYLFFPDATATEVLSQMVERWRSETTALRLGQRAEELGYDVHDVMTIASLIQAEGSLLGERDKARIAQVIYNRLEQVPPNPSAGLLQIDATIDFIYGDKVARRTNAEIDAVADDPYNTYRQAGLPPGPIAAPGVESIEAALSPTGGDLFFYATVNLRTGETKFASTFEEFQVLEAELDEYCATQSDAC